jgi:hypothetical protein
MGKWAGNTKAEGVPWSSRVWGTIRLIFGKPKSPGGDTRTIPGQLSYTSAPCDERRFSPKEIHLLVVHSFEPMRSHPERPDNPKSLVVAGYTIG